MIGLCGMIFVFLVLICLFSYWISWEMQHNEQRHAFRTQIWSDVVNLFGKFRALFRSSGIQPVTAKTA